MTQKTDLYTILTSYANKNNVPYLDPETFITFLEGYAKKNALENPEWLIWMEGTGAKFWTELAALAEEGKCVLLCDTPNGRIYMPNYCHRLLEQYYSDLDNNADLPFPCEESLEIAIPENQLQSMAVNSNSLGTFLDESLHNSDPREQKDPRDLKDPYIIRINFPNELPPALVINSSFPRRLTEACLVKIRSYLREYGNVEYSLNKLTLQLMGKESMIRDNLNKIIIRPLDCYTAIAEGGEFSSVFWAHFCALIKNDLNKKIDRLSSDTAILQSVYILETLNSIFKSRAVKAREKEEAFKSLEQNLAKAPYFYSLDQIIKFTNSKGLPLLGQYTKEELAERLEKLTCESRNNKLPELLILKVAGNKPYYTSKNKMLPLCNRLIVETRDKVRKEMSRHWLKLLKNYRKEPAMENDRDFDKSLFQYAGKICPMLNSILEDPKFQVIYSEMEQVQGIPLACRILNQGDSVPYSSLFLIKRKELLNDVRLMLPFWYSVSFFVSVVSFFKSFVFKFTNDNAEEFPNNENLEDNETDSDKMENIAKAVREIEHAMVPQYHTLDSYLEELKFRWVRLIDKQARDNLVEDVNSLVRDNLRQTLRVQKHYTITRDNLVQLASNILSRTPSLDALGAKDSLRTYIELYLVKLLESFKLNFSINEAPYIS